LKPSEKIKLLGFKSMAQAAAAADEGEKNLVRWSARYPRRFELILKGLAFERMNDQLNAAFGEMDSEE